VVKNLSLDDKMEGMMEDLHAIRKKPLVGHAVGEGKPFPDQPAPEPKLITKTIDSKPIMPRNRLMPKHKRVLVVNELEPEETKATA